MTQVWKVLDQEYGRPEDISREAVNGLMQMHLNAKTDALKFLQMHQEFTKVKNDLVKVSMIDELSNASVIRLVVSKLPDKASKTRWITYKEVNMIQNPKPKLLDMFTEYMDMERRIQKDLSKLEAETIPASKVKVIGTDSTKPEVVVTGIL